MRWARAFSLLVRHGHRYDDIVEHYSWGQFKAFLSEAQRLDNERHSITLLGMRLSAFAAQGSDEADKSLTQLIKSLTNLDTP